MYGGSRRGYLFTAHISGYQQFKAVTATETREGPTHKRTLLNFSFIPDSPTAIKIVGRLYRMARWLLRDLRQPA